MYFAGVNITILLKFSTLHKVTKFDPDCLL